MIDQQHCQELHSLYCKLAGRDLPMSMGNLFAWEKFSLRFTGDDLRVVMKYIQKLAGEHKPHRSLIFRSLISGPESLDYFAEDLAEAKALGRVEKVDGNKAEVLRATGRAVKVEKRVRSVGEILASEHAFEQFRSLKDRL